MRAPSSKPSMSRPAKQAKATASDGGRREQAALRHVIGRRDTLAI